ncbi:UvrD-helicase domain-containing protein [Flammeovirgaceae bacterium SG7u.111]|nr:UvrD-helicase domain-containing protein [Flammeovirgaceae bacterium SG7u.132]WPO38010.1 UvrD-helicase domain-containing protein [Flammeovirgaceae bacterium SG7u.111]
MKFKVYRSSAGSGKTFTLTKEYLKLVLAPPFLQGGFSPFYYRNILAVTFTNDAANEMKERILSKLEDFAKLPPEAEDDMLNMILGEFQTEKPELGLTKAVLVGRAKAAYENLIHNYSDFAVSTIDAFNNRVVQSFKKDLQLPFNFEIELDTSDLLDEAIDLLHDKIGKDEEDKGLGELLVGFSLQKADDESSWFIDKELKDFGQETFKEEQKLLLEKLGNLQSEDFLKLRKNINEAISSFEKKVNDIAEKALQLIQDKNLTAKDFYYTSKGIVGHFSKLKGSLAKTNLAPNSYVQKTIDEDKWYGSKITPATEDIIDSISGELMSYYEGLEMLRVKEWGNYLIAQKLRKNIYLLGTANELGKLLEKLKIEKNIVHISDFNNRINTIVEEEPVPYIYERIGERFRHILIDEFQDTSQMQWHNLIPLLANSLGNDMETLVVGDAKQAIYRWRGGKADMLVNLPEVPTIGEDSALRLEAQIFKEQQNILSLNTNYRSKDNVINFNNSFYSKLRNYLSSKIAGVAAYYQEVEQNTVGKTGGEVQITFIEDRRKKEVLNEANFQLTLQAIEQLQKESYELADITILTRNNGDGVFLAEKLIEQGIPVVSKESLLVKNAESVKFLVSMLDVLRLPENPLAKMDAFLFLDWYQKLKSENPKTILSGEVLEEISPTLVLNDIIKFLELINKHFGFEVKGKSLQYLNVYEICEELVRVFHLQLFDEEQVYLQKFLDFTLGYTQKRNGNAADFLEHWERKNHALSIAPPQTGNAVRIMTIHKSKGLQFPVVIMPFADWSAKAKGNIWKNNEGSEFMKELSSYFLSINEDLQHTSLAEDYNSETSASFIDAFNMLYVATTRAVEKLFIFTKDLSAKKKKDGIDIPISASELIYMYRALERPLDDQLVPLELEVSPEGGEATQLVCSRWKVFEDKATREKQKAKKEQAFFELGKTIHTEARDKIRMRRISLQNSDEELGIAAFFISKKKTGILMHRAFEWVKYAEDLDRSIQALVNEGLISQEEVGEIKEQMERAIAVPEINPYFQKGSGYEVLNEQDLLLNFDGKSLSTLRPDRLMIKGKEAVLIDYKTGMEDIQKHSKQINQYAAVLQKAGYSVKKKYILYTDAPKAVEVN